MRRLEKFGLSKVVSLLIVLAGFILLVALLVWLVVPVVVDELGKLISYLPAGLDEIEEQPWFESLNASLGGALTGFVGCCRRPSRIRRSGSRSAAALCGSAWASSTASSA